MKRADCTFEGEPFFAPGRMSSFCKECGFTVIRRGTGTRWTHMNPQPTGDPWPHSAQPGGPRVDKMVASEHWRSARSESAED